MDKKWTASKFWNLKKVEYHSNDFLVLLQIFRVYLLCNVFITLNDFYNARADRVSKLISTKLDFFLSFKLTYRDKPVTCIIFLTFISCFSLAYMLRLVESPVSKDLVFGDPNYDKNNYDLFSNSLWNVLVIYTTVGYGEFFPKTTLGMCVCVITSLYGIILVSIIIMTMQNLSQFNKREYSSKDLIDRLKAKNDLIEPSRNYFIENLRYLVIQNKYMTKLAKLEKQYGNMKSDIEKENNHIDLSKYIKTHEEENINIDEKIDDLNNNINTETRLNNENDVSHNKSKMNTLKGQIIELKTNFCNDMEKILISKIEKKRELKKGLKDYYRDYMKYDPLDDVKEQVDILENKMFKMEEKNIQIEKLLRSFLNKVSI